MYKNIEKEYKKNNYLYKFDVYYWIVGIIMFIITFPLKGHLEDSLINAIVIFFTFLIIIMFVIIDVRRKIPKLCNKNFHSRFKQYVKGNRQSKSYKLRKILNHYGFNSKEKIQLAINYFSHNIPIKVKK